MLANTPITEKSWFVNSDPCLFAVFVLTYFMSRPLSVPAENIRKPEIFWYFQGV